MELLNVEIKAHCNDPEGVKTKLRELNSDFRGVDAQVDTYFNVPNGRLKLREGNIERALIQYHRPDQEGPKRSDVVLVKQPADSGIKEALTRALGIMVVVSKQREIHYLPDAKIHVDHVEGLGAFVEIEVLASSLQADERQLRARCEELMALLGVDPDGLVEASYSDLLMQNDKARVKRS